MFSEQYAPISHSGSSNLCLVPRQPAKTLDARLLLALFDPDTDDDAIGEALGVGRSTVNKWRNGRAYMINLYRADTLAIRLGYHPALIWGSDWWAAE
jgi:hypothetical protein